MSVLKTRIHSLVTYNYGDWIHFQEKQQYYCLPFLFNDEMTETDGGLSVPLFKE